MMERLVRAEPINHLIKMQLVVLVITSLIILCIQDISMFVAYLYGSAIGIIISFLQRWHLFAAAKNAKADAGKNLGRAYRCIVERWFVTIIMFAIGFLIFLSDEMMLAGFIAMQGVVLFGNYKRA
ncbi:MAG TPA: ATP synthase subunit I [Methylophaga sp.]|nr:ATP synthase subunit I [Methylophaga sp.]HEC58624.1 ATP synthase subunit I [Methylophaga sp.]